MSKKSKPRDGSNGRGVKGEKREFEELFRPPAAREAMEETEDRQQTHESEEVVS